MTVDENRNLSMRRLLPVVLLTGFILLGVTACGRKGPPQPPIKIRPEPAPSLVAKQHGHQVTLGWTLPEFNTDESDLVGISRLELYRFEELQKPKKDDEEDEDGVGPYDMRYDVLDQVSESFLGGPGGEDGEDYDPYGAYGFGGFGDEWSGDKSLGDGDAVGGGQQMLGGGSGSRRGSREGWAGARDMRGPRVTPGFRSTKGEFISAFEFERKAELIYSPDGPDIEELTIDKRVLYMDTLPEMDEEIIERTRYYYAVRVIDIKDREGLFSEFLMVTPYEPPETPESVAAVTSEKSVDLTWQGPPVDPWARIAWEKRQKEKAEREMATGTRQKPAAGAGGEAGETSPLGDEAADDGFYDDYYGDDYYGDDGYDDESGAGQPAGGSGIMVGGSSGGGPGGGSRKVVDPSTKDKVAIIESSLIGPVCPEEDIPAWLEAMGQATDTAAEADEAIEPPPEEERVLAGWIIQPPGTFREGAGPRLRVLSPDPWPLVKLPTPPYIAGFNVYKWLDTALVPSVVPLNSQPMAEKKFSDPTFTFEETYHYVVRTVLVTETGLVESDDSEHLLLTPADTYPPKAPANLTYVAAEGTVALIWNRSRDRDFLGFHVYRQSEGSEDEASRIRLTGTPLTRAKYQDETVETGRRYEYSVTAVDQADPPNESEPSIPVTVLAR